MFACGWYEVKWYNAKEEVVKSQEQYLESNDYNREVMKMQNAYLRGEDVKKLTITPIKK